jgi:hypothetical protein
MSQQSYKEAIKNPALRQFARNQRAFFNLTDSGAGISAGQLVAVSSNTVLTGTEQSSAIIGVTRKAWSASAANVEVEFGAVPVKLASPVAQFDEIAARGDGLAGKKLASQVTLVNAQAGGDFANQPAGDGVEIVSASANDDTQTVTVYGTITGALTTVTSETVTLTGTNAVSTDITTWQTILGIEISAATAGDITVREASADQTITTITAGTTSAGVQTISTTNGYGLIPRHDASGASTAAVGLIGTSVTGAALTVVDALNGTTEEDHGTTAFATVTKALIGAVASTVDVTILTNESTDSYVIGVALDASTVSGVAVDAYIKPFFY